MSPHRCLQEAFFYELLFTQPPVQYTVESRDTSVRDDMICPRVLNIQGIDEPRNTEVPQIGNCKF